MDLTVDMTMDQTENPGELTLEDTMDTTFQYPVIRSVIVMPPPPRLPFPIRCRTPTDHKQETDTRPQDDLAYDPSWEPSFTLDEAARTSEDTTLTVLTRAADTTLDDSVLFPPRLPNSECASQVRDMYTDSVTSISQPRAIPAATMELNLSVTESRQVYPEGFEGRIPHGLYPSVSPARPYPFALIIMS